MKVPLSQGNQGQETALKAIRQAKAYRIRDDAAAQARIRLPVEYGEKPLKP